MKFQGNQVEAHVALEDRPTSKIHPRIENMTISALSPDGEIRIRKIIRLFVAAYGRSFPISSVYREAFWKSHIGDRFISLVARIGNEPIAHVAVYPDPNYRRNVQISLPVVRPDMAHLVNDIGLLARETLWSLRRRQHWEMLYFFDMTNVAGFRVFGENVLQTKLTAICPNYLPETGFRARGVRLSTLQRPKDGKRTDVLLTTRVFGDTLPPAHAHSNIYLPDEHKSICAELYHPLGLIRTHAERDTPFELPHPQAQAVEVQYYKQTRVQHVFILPSLLGSLSHIHGSFSDQYPVALAFLDLCDPKTPAACAVLEHNGFRFCGILPLYQGRDRIIYFRADTSLGDLGQSSLLAPCSKTTMMYRYIMNYTSSPSHNGMLLNAHLVAPEKASRPFGEILRPRTEGDLNESDKPASRAFGTRR